MGSAAVLDIPNSLTRPISPFRELGAIRVREYEDIRAHLPIRLTKIDELTRSGGQVFLREGIQLGSIYLCFNGGEFLE
jgi:hypothetical protein